MTVRDREGIEVKSATRTLEPSFFQQYGASAILDGYVLTGGETITVTVTSGSAFVYGSTTDKHDERPERPVREAHRVIPARMECVGKASAFQSRGKTATSALWPHIRKRRPASALHMVTATVRRIPSTMPSARPRCR